MMSLRPLLLLVPVTVASIGAVACGNRPSDDPESASALTEVVNPAVSCAIDYGSDRAFGPIAHGGGDLDHGVVVASKNPRYALYLDAQPDRADAAGFEISTSAALFHGTTRLAYIVLPRAAFQREGTLFELGADISPVRANGYDGQKHTFTNVRAYCWGMQQAAPDAGPIWDPDASSADDAEGGLDPIGDDGGTDAVSPPWWLDASEG